MIILAAVLLIFLLGTLYHAIAGFWLRPRMALLTFVFTLVPVFYWLLFKGSLSEPEDGWFYLIIAYLIAHLSGIAAYCWTRFSEWLVRVFNRLKVSLLVALCISVVLLIVMRDKGLFAIAVGLSTVVVVVFGGFWLFRIVRDQLKGRTEPESSQAEPENGWATPESGNAQPEEAKPKARKGIHAILRNLVDNLRARLRLKVRLKKKRPRISGDVIIEHLRSRLSLSIPLEYLGALLRRLFRMQKLRAWIESLRARLRRLVRAFHPRTIFSRFTKSKKPPP